MNTNANNRNVYAYPWLMTMFIFTGPCPAGFFSYNGYEPCRPCAPGYYQTASQSTECIACNSGSTTLQPNSTDANDCVGSKYI